MKQQDRLKNAAGSRSGSTGRNDSAVEDGVASAIEITTEASTRKYSNTQSERTFENEDRLIEDEEEEDDELPTNQQIISPQEVKDLIEKLWRKEKDLLSLIYGKYHPVADGE
jgi:DNA-directed RNA polymerase specialized sigma subunit